MSKSNTETRQIWFHDLGYFTARAVDGIKKAMEGRSYYNFHVISSSFAGNHSIGIEVTTEDTDEEVRSMFLHCVINSLSGL